MGMPCVRVDGTAQAIVVGPPPPSNLDETVVFEMGEETFGE